MMANRFMAYFFRDGDSNLDANKFNPIFKDIDLRIGVLEDLEISWTDAVRLVTNTGLTRINNIIEPLVNNLSTVVEQGEASAQALDDKLTLLEGSIVTPDEMAQALSSKAEQSELDALKALIYAGL